MEDYRYYSHYAAHVEARKETAAGNAGILRFLLQTTKAQRAELLAALKKTMETHRELKRAGF